jgi:spore germination cell wall hydrolase CwlJ-like protein
MKLLISIIILYAACQYLNAATHGQKVVAAVLMAEAWGEGEQAMTAVAEVIRTRADKQKISPLAVVTAPKQFSCLNGKKLEQLVQKFESKKDFAIALKIAKIMYNTPELLPGHAKGASHFATTTCRVHWTKGKAPVSVVGSLAFYKIEI